METIEKTSFTIQETIFFYNFAANNKIMKSRIPLFIVTAIFWCLGVCHLNAQTNPKPGCIITYDNDSVFGVIDYRTESRNAMECKFQKGGTGEFTTYTPADIKGYRLSDKGAFYLTKTVNINGKTLQLFAEYLLKGGVSLYYISLTDGNYYYFEGEDGKTGLVKERDYLDYSGVDGMALKRHDMDYLSQIFYKDNETIEKLWKISYDKKNMTRLTRNYSEKYCSEAGYCVQYLYDEKKTVALKARFFVGAGFKVGRIKPKYINGSENDLWFSVNTPNITLGCEFEFPRLSKNLFAQAHLDIGYLNAKKDDRKLSGCALSHQLGLGYRFCKESKVSPIVRGGIYFSHLLGPSTENMKNSSGDNRHFTQFEVGVYAGIGSDIAIGKHILRATANYEYNSSSGFLQTFADEEGIKASVLAISVGYVF